MDPSQQTFKITGKLIDISRAEAKSLIEQNSGSIVSNVSKNLTFNNWWETNYEESWDCKRIKIKIINQSEWSKMLNNKRS